jgi:hypothetical protein
MTPVFPSWLPVKVFLICINVPILNIAPPKKIKINLDNNNIIGYNKL